MLGKLDYQELQSKEYNNKTAWFLSMIGAIIIASIDTFLFEKNIFNLGVWLTFIYYFIVWLFTLFTVFHLFHNDKKDKYIKGAWVLGLFFIPIVIVPLYYFRRNK